MKYTIALVALLLVGCATTKPPTRTVKIESDPPGARIYFGISRNEQQAKREREYVGTSPCSITVPCDDEGRFVNNVSSFARPKAVFMAEPPFGATNLFAQQQIFAVPALFIRPSTIPERVFFDLHKPE